MPELVEHVRQLGLGYADARIPHREGHVGVRPLDTNPDLSRLGELLSVRQQVDQYLPHLVPVGMYLARLAHVDVQAQSLLIGQGTDRLHRGRDHVSNLELGDRNIHPASLDPGQIDDIVDKAQQVSAVALNGR